MRNLFIGLGTAVLTSMPAASMAGTIIETIFHADIVSVTASGDLDGHFTTGDDLKVTTLVDPNAPDLEADPTAGFFETHLPDAFHIELDGGIEISSALSTVVTMVNDPGDDGVGVVLGHISPGSFTPDLAVAAGLPGVTTLEALGYIGRLDATLADDSLPLDLTLVIDDPSTMVYFEFASANGHLELRAELTGLERREIEASVPEPTSSLAFAIGSLIVAGVRRRA